MNIPENTILVYNVLTQAFGLAVAIVPSPYVAEEMRGIERVQVWAEVPMAGGISFNWDFWPLGDVVAATVVSDDTLVINPVVALIAA